MTPATDAAQSADLIRAFSVGLGLSPSATLSSTVSESLVVRIEAAVAAWPGVALERAAFAQFLAERVVQTGRPPAELARFFVSDLWLTFACSRADRIGLKHFEQRFMARVGEYVRMRGVDLDDVAQTLRERLLVGNGRPRILDYLGTGPLDGWVRVAAVRTAISLRRAAKQWLTMSDDATERAVSNDASPEAKVAQEQLGARLRSALKAAFDALDDKQRNLITFYYLDGETLEKLSLVYAVHLSTVARWVERARAQLCQNALEQLGAATAALLDEGDFDAAIDGLIPDSLRG